MALGMGRVVLEHFDDFRQLLVSERVQGSAKGGQVALASDGNVVKVAHGQLAVDGHAVEKLLGEDFGGGLKRNFGAANGVGRAGIEG